MTRVTVIRPLLLAPLVCQGQGCQAPKPGEYTSAGNQTILTALKQVAEKHRVPALGGAAITELFGP